MANYTKSVNYAVKDGLTTGDPSKTILGAELDNEFNNLATSIGTKANANAPSLTGTGTFVNLTGTTLNVNDLNVDTNVLTVNSATDVVDIQGGLTHTGDYILTGNINVTGNVSVSGTVDGRDVSVDGAKLDTIESNAKDDQTGAEIKTLYESQANTNAFTDAEKTKLTGIAAGANAYVLPVADTGVLGGVRDGTDISIDASGNVSVVNDSHTHNMANLTGSTYAAGSGASITSLNASNLTTGTIPSARVAQAAVTQHQAAINAGKVDGYDIVVTGTPGSDANTIYFVT